MVCGVGNTAGTDATSGPERYEHDASLDGEAHKLRYFFRRPGPYDRFRCVNGDVSRPYGHVMARK